MENELGFLNYEIPTTKPLTWERIPKKRDAWQLVDEGRCLAKITISLRSKKAVGSFLGHEFWIEPSFRERLKSSKWKVGYSIKLKNVEGGSTNEAIVNWGVMERILGWGESRCFTRLILKDNRIYSLNYWEPKPMGPGFDISLVSSNPGDEGRTIGITHFTENFFLIPVLLGFTERKKSKFEIKQYYPCDPSIALLASICYYFVRIRYLDKSSI
jgi:hypothetical protein